MKLIKSLVAVIALSLIAMPLARAQETETPTEKATSSPGETSDTEKSETKKSETKSETEKSESEKSATEKSKKSEASPSAKSGSAASAQPAAKGSVDAQLKDIENRWEAAFQSHNISVVEPILGNDYVLTTEKGEMFNRSGALKYMKKDTDVYEKAANSKMAVHMINRDAAVVTGMSHEAGKDKGGKPFDRTFRWTDTFVNRNGGWQCVATQVTLVAQK